MTNLYGIQRTDQHHPTRYYEVAPDMATAIAQFRKYWNIIAPITVTLLRSDAKPVFDLKADADRCRADADSGRTA